MSTPEPHHGLRPPAVRAYRNEQGWMVTEIHISADPDLLWMPLSCPNCTNSCVLMYLTARTSSRNTITRCPQVVCKECGWGAPPRTAEEHLQRLKDQLGPTTGNVVDFLDSLSDLETPNFGWLKGPARDFKFDKWEHRFMPGLYRKTDTYLTPVYFKQEVLNRFKTESRYEISQGGFNNSDVTVRDSSGNFLIRIGLNRSGFVVAWLGDLDGLPKQEQYHFLSYNQSSQGDVASGFYDAEINLEDGEPSSLQRLIDARSQFVSITTRFLGEPCTHMNAATSELLLRLHPPTTGVIDSELDVIEKIWKVCGESLDKKPFERSLRGEGQPASKLGSLKILQEWLTQVVGCDGASAVLGPLFVLYDLRKVKDHLYDPERQRAEIADAATRLGLSGSQTIVQIYESLVDSLADMFIDLSEQVKSLAESCR